MPKVSKFAQLISESHALELNSLKSFDSESLGYTVFWKPDDYKTRQKYFNDLLSGDKTTAMLKCFFYRACDEKGKRMFLTQEDWAIIKDATSVWTAIFEVAAEMLGGNVDDMFPDREYTDKEAEKN